ncbi:MAG: hypothetical protein QOI03_1274, partial [Solirubrobacteraceae bacterium]|nr:hypothetical protein [Solirubrobacteraceae bacterium]
MSGVKPSSYRLDSVKARCLGVLAGALLIAGWGPVSAAVAAPANMVALGQASTY